MEAKFHRLLVHKTLMKYSILDILHELSSISTQQKIYSSFHANLSSSCIHYCSTEHKFLKKKLLQLLSNAKQLFLEKNSSFPKASLTLSASTVFFCGVSVNEEKFFVLMGIDLNIDTQDPATSFPVVTGKL